MKRSRSPASPVEIDRQLSRRILKADSKPSEVRDATFRKVIASIPEGRVATYGQIAAAAGYPLHHRAVARLLRSEPPGRLPWQRVVGSGGAIKLQGEGAAEQRLRLQMEGVAFSGKRVNMAAHGHEFEMWRSDW